MLRPRPVPTAIAAVGVTILVGLGVWQISRHFETAPLVAAQEQKLEGPPLDGAGLRAGGDRVGRVAAVRGVWRSEHQWLVDGEVRSGVPGVEVITALALDGGGHVLVRQGFVPEPEVDATLAQLDAAGPAEVRGLVLALDDTPATPLPSGRWPAPATAAMARAVPDALDVVIQQGERRTTSRLSTRGPWPEGGWTARTEGRPHLQYAATWFAIAGALAWTWGLWSSTPRDGSGRRP